MSELRDMPPSSTDTNLPHGTSVHMEHIAQRPIGIAISMQLPHFNNIGSRQCSIAVRFASGHSFWMGIVPMFLSSCIIAVMRCGHTSFSHHVVDIVFLSAKKQMERVDTGGIVAMVQNVPFPRVCGVIQKIRNAGRRISELSNGHTTVSLRTMCRLPFPTPRGLNHDFSPKTFSVLRSNGRKNMIFDSHWGFTSLVKFQLVRLGENVISILPSCFYFSTQLAG